MTETPNPVHAAGVVLLRSGDAGAETLAVHRPHRSDWSLPKGKLETGEHPIVAAVRECEEETGITPILGASLGRLEYEAFGEPKIVDYWVARIGESEMFNADDEIDELRWVPVDSVTDAMSYPSDVKLVKQASIIPPTTPLIILRHTQAVKRSQFDGTNDQERPISGKGRSHAKALVPLLSAFGIEAVHSSSSLRCTQTVKRFAKSVGATIQTEPALTEEDHTIRPKAAIRRMKKLLEQQTPLVVCTHRPVLPSLMQAVANTLDLADNDPRLDPKLSPGGFVVIHRVFTESGRIAAASIERHDVTP